MRILVLIHEYPPIGGGGGRIAQEIARKLARLGHDLTVMAPLIRGLSTEENDHGVRLVRIPSFRRKPFVGDLLAMSGYLFVGFFAGLWLIFKHKPDVIHVHFAVPAGMLAWALSKLTGIPYVLTSHLGDVPGGVPEKTDRWFKWVYPFTPRIWRDAKAVTAISDFTRDLATFHYPVDIYVIPNGIEVIQNETSIKLSKQPQIVFAGRFVQQKNPLVIPRLLNELKDLDWHCVLIGDGELLEQVKHQVKSLGLGDRFTFPGWLETDDVEIILNKSDILFMPSLAEGIPLTGLQSLAHGLAIVASRVGGLPQLVTEGENGYLHEPTDTEGFKASLRTLLSKQEVLLQARLASLRIARQFDIDLIVKRYEKTLLRASKKDS